MKPNPLFLAPTSHTDDPTVTSLTLTPKPTTHPSTDGTHGVLNATEAFSRQMDLRHDAAGTDCQQTRKSSTCCGVLVTLLGFI